MDDMSAAPSPAPSLAPSPALGRRSRRHWIAWLMAAAALGAGAAAYWFDSDYAANAPYRGAAPRSLPVSRTTPDPILAPIPHFEPPAIPAPEPPSQPKRPVTARKFGLD